MESQTSFSQFLLDQFSVLSTPAMLMQIGVVAIALGVAWLIHRRVTAAVHLRADEVPKNSFRYWITHSGRRVVFPLAALAIVVSARGLLFQLNAAVALLDIAIVLLLSLAAIRMFVYVIRKTITPSYALKAWENVIAGIVWIAVALHLVGWLPDVLTWMETLGFSMGQTRFSLLLLFKLVIAIGAMILVALWIARIIENKLDQSTQLDAGMRVGLAKLSKFTLLTLAMLIALNSVGIDLTALTVFGGALGVGLGFGLQRITSNLVSGMILVFERSIRPGDVVSVGDSFGQVKALLARCIVVRSRDGVETLIPNENLITTQVINWTYSDRRVRVKIPIQISYSDDPESAMQLMLKCAAANSRVLKDPPPQCLLLEFGDNGITLELQGWISDPEEGVTNVRSEVYIAVWHAFKVHNITIPFPQRDVHVKSLPPIETQPS